MIFIWLGGGLGAVADILLIIGVGKWAKRWGRSRGGWELLAIFFTPLIASVFLLMLGDQTPKENLSDIMNQHRDALVTQFSELKSLLRTRLPLTADAEDVAFAEESLNLEDLPMEDSDS